MASTANTGTIINRPKVILLAKVIPHYRQSFPSHQGKSKMRFLRDCRPPPRSPNRGKPREREAQAFQQGLQAFRHVRKPFPRELKPFQQKHKLSDVTQSFSNEKESFSHEKESFSHEKESFSHAKESFSHAKESFSHEKESFSNAKESFSNAKESFSNVKEKPWNEASSPNKSSKSDNQEIHESIRNILKHLIASKSLTASCQTARSLPSITKTKNKHLHEFDRHQLQLAARAKEWLRARGRD
jgi:hypothetical protein